MAVAKCAAPRIKIGRRLLSFRDVTPHQVARALKAAVLAVGHLHEVYSSFMLTGADAASGTSNDVRDPRLASGLPYMLWDARKVRERGNNCMNTD